MASGAGFGLFMAMESLASEVELHCRGRCRSVMSCFPAASHASTSSLPRSRLQACPHSAWRSPSTDGWRRLSWSAGVTASGQCFPAQSATHRSRRMNTGQEIFTSNLLILRSLCCFAALMSGQLSQSRNMNLDIHSRSVELFQISPHAYRPRPYWLSAPLRPTAPRVIGRAPFVYVFINIYLYYKPRLQRAGRDGTAQAPRCSGCGHHTHASAAR